MTVDPFSLQLTESRRLGRNVLGVIDTGADLLVFGEGLVKKPLRGEQSGFRCFQHPSSVIGACGSGYMINGERELYTIGYRLVIPSPEGTFDVLAQTFSDQGWLGVDVMGHLLGIEGIVKKLFDPCESVSLHPASESTLIRADTRYFELVGRELNAVALEASSRDVIFSLGETFWCYRPHGMGHDSFVQPLNGKSNTHFRADFRDVSSPIVFEDGLVLFVPTRQGEDLIELDLTTLQSSTRKGVKSSFTGGLSLAGCQSKKERCLFMAGRNQAQSQALIFDPESSRAHILDTGDDMPTKLWTSCQWLLREEQAYLTVTIDDESWLLEFGAS